jgi:hypothetical protein
MNNLSVRKCYAFCKICKHLYKTTDSEVNLPAKKKSQGTRVTDRIVLIFSWPLSEDYALQITYDKLLIHEPNFPHILSEELEILNGRKICSLTSRGNTDLIYKVR